MGQTDPAGPQPPTPIAVLGPHWTQLTAQDTYATGLRALVDGLLAAN